MICRRAEEIDLASYVSDPSDARFRSFRAHFPGCDDCTAALESWTETERVFEQATGFEHPTTTSLLAFADASAPSEHSTITRHLEVCAECRSAIVAFQAMTADLSAAPVPTHELTPAKAGPNAFDTLRAWWSAASENLSPTHVWALAATAAVIALAVVLSRPDATSEPDTRIASDATSTSREQEEDELEPPLPERSGPSVMLADEDVRPKESTVPDPEPDRRQILALETDAGPRLDATSGEPVEIAETTSERSKTESETLEPGESWVLAMLDLPTPNYQDPLDPVNWRRLPPTVRASRDGPSPHLQALAPNHVAHTAAIAPQLFWFSDSDISGPLTFSLLEEETGDEQVFELESPVVAGIHRIDLGALGLELAPGSMYRWFVTTPSPSEPEEELNAAGAIRRVSRSPDLAGLEAGPRSRRLHVYADEGLWYDALALLSEAIDGGVATARLRAQRADFLDQAELNEAAEFDRASALRGATTDLPR